MTIAINNTSSTSDNNNAIISWSHTSGGSDKVLIVFVSWMQNESVGVSPSATYNGVAMTTIYSSNTNSADAVGVAIFGMINPPAGAYTVSIAMGGRVSAGAGAITFTGADQSTGWRTASAGNPVTPTSQLKDYLVDVMSVFSNSTFTPNAGQTALFALQTSSTASATLGDKSYHGASYKYNIGAGSMGWSGGSVAAVAVIAIPDDTNGFFLLF